MKFWIQTFSDGAIDLLNPLPEQYRLIDIAHSLARQCRYTGHSATHTPISEHCIRAARLVLKETGDASLAWEALVHDVPETAVGDVSGPMKGAMRAIAAKDGRSQSDFDVIEERHVKACEIKLMVRSDPERRSVVKAADVRDLIAESARNFGPPPQIWATTAKQHDIPIFSGGTTTLLRRRWLLSVVKLAPAKALADEASAAMSYIDKEKGAV